MPGRYSGQRERCLAPGAGHRRIDLIDMMHLGHHVHAIGGMRDNRIATELLVRLPIDRMPRTSFTTRQGLSLFAQSSKQKVTVPLVRAGGGVVAHESEEKERGDEPSSLKFLPLGPAVGENFSSGSSSSLLFRGGSPFKPPGRGMLCVSCRI